MGQVARGGTQLVSVKKQWLPHSVRLGKRSRMTTITATQAKDLLVKSWSEFNEDQAPRLGAALAYYTVLSLAPLLILLIALAGLVFGKEAATGQLVSQIQGMVGKEGAEAIQQMIAGASKPASGIVASIIGFLTLLFGASSVAGELKAALNIIWDRPADSGEGVVGMVTQRSKALGVVLGGGFLLLVSLTVSSLLPLRARSSPAFSRSPSSLYMRYCSSFDVRHCGRLRGAVQVPA